MEQSVAQVQYNNHIKEALRSGKPVELSMKDFLPSKPKSIKRTYNKKRTIQPEDYKMKTAEEIVSHLRLLHKYAIESYELSKKSNNSWNKPIDNWSKVQSYKCLICTITGEEFEYEQMPN